MAHHEIGGAFCRQELAPIASVMEENQQFSLDEIPANQYRRCDDSMDRSSVLNCQRLHAHHVVTAMHAGRELTQLLQCAGKIAHLS